MPFALMSLPRELVQEIASHLLLADQSFLSRTCKALNDLLSPVVWGDIELHHNGTHEGIDFRGKLHWHLNELKEGRVWELTNPIDDAWYSLPDNGDDDDEYPYQGQPFEPSPRKYAQCSSDPPNWGDRLYRKPGRKCTTCPSRSPVVYDNNQFGREEKFICVRRFTTKNRWEQLAQNVRSLCISIGIDDEVMMGISTLKNIRSLEIVGLALVAPHLPTAPEINLPKLENLKLRGYFSSAFVRQVCSNSKHIKHLDLGLLATPTDDEAYKDSLLASESTRAPVTLAQAEYYQRNSTEAAAIASEQIEWPPGEDDNNAVHPVEVWRYHADLVPWAIHGPIWLPRSLPSRLESLTHLHLVKPYTGEVDMHLGDDVELIPHRYEHVLNIEWQLLLEGVGPSLKELILEHRAPAYEQDALSDREPNPLPKSYKAIFNEWPSDSDRGDEMFCRSVLRLLLEWSKEFSNIRHLALRGIRIKGLANGMQEAVVPGRNREPDNDELLRDAYPECEVELFDDVYVIHADSFSEYCTGNKNTKQAIQDEGDGLLYSLTLHNDYRKRFGPQWRVPG